MKYNQSMKQEEQLRTLEELREAYEGYKQQKLSLDMSRGKPCTEQLELSMGLLECNDNYMDQGIDVRNYGVLPGIPSARRLFASVLQVSSKEQVLVGGNSSLSLMYYLVDLGWRKGYPESPRPWSQEEKVKFLCPVPGYDRHFAITEDFGIEMIPIPLLEDGPDMEQVERMVQEDSSIKGIWCVPVYSNPDGRVYSEDMTLRLAKMQAAAPDFKIIWDNAYCVHHLSDTQHATPSIVEACADAGHPNRAFALTSTSKVTFPGAGVAAVASSAENIRYLIARMNPMTISYDKMNQMRHVAYLKDMDGIREHMKKHREILWPKFQCVLNILKEELAAFGEDAHWTNPEGGYFISLFLMDGCAKRTVQLCAEAGVTLTPAGAAFPYGNDPKDSHIRIAPSYPSLQELETATKLLCLCAKIAMMEKIAG